MNKERILELADDIENGRYKDVGITKFDMNWLLSPTFHCGTHCGTAACIAGFAAVKYYPRFVKRTAKGVTWDLYRRDPWEEDYMTMTEAAEQALGIDSYTGMNLFYPSPDDIELSDITPQQAAKVLRHLAETGEVDWERALER